jgi:hypothetical protein
VFEDALVGGSDEELDVLRENLAASKGVMAVLHEDREVFHLNVDGLDASEVLEKASEAAGGSVSATTARDKGTRPSRASG